MVPKMVPKVVQKWFRNWSKKWSKTTENEPKMAPKMGPKILKNGGVTLRQNLDGGFQEPLLFKDVPRWLQDGPK